MYTGDLVRCRDISGDYGDIGIIIEYEKWEKIATVHMQKSGAKRRIAARDIEIIKRAPHNHKKLKDLADKRAQQDIFEEIAQRQLESRIGKNNQK